MSTTKRSCSTYGAPEQDPSCANCHQREFYVSLETGCPICGYRRRSPNCPCTCHLDPETDDPDCPACKEE